MIKRIGTSITSGGQRKTKEKARIKGTGKKREGGDGDGHAREDSFKGYRCEELGQRASEYYKKTAYFIGTGKTNTHQ